MYRLAARGQNHVKEGRHAHSRNQCTLAPTLEELLTISTYEGSLFSPIRRKLTRLHFAKMDLRFRFSLTLLPKIHPNLIGFTIQPRKAFLYDLDVIKYRAKK